VPRPIATLFFGICADKARDRGIFNVYWRFLVFELALPRGSVLAC
jgi:hypothetical protein